MSSTKRANELDGGQWVEAHGDLLFSFAMSRVNDIDLAEDLVQETLLAALGRRTAFAGRSLVETWLVGILKHKIADHFRKDTARSKHGAEARPSTDEDLAKWADEQFTPRGKWKVKPNRWRRRAADPQDSIEGQELGRVISDCLDRLPAQASQVFLMAERTETSLDQLSKFFGLSTTNIGVILHRARMALRRCLEMNWFGRRSHR